jgi:hypothetical protein
VNSWTLRVVSLRFAVSDWTLCKWRLPLNVREITLAEGIQPVDTLRPPIAEVSAGSCGFMIRGMPVTVRQPAISATPPYIRYVQRQYRHYYIDMRITFDDYRAKFSSKARSTINRKLKKYAEYCGGSIRWRTYASADEMLEFHRLARTVSMLTYQERLLDAGLPASPSFVAEMLALAEMNYVRAFVLFHGEKPVSYLYCPVRDDVLQYAYLGYDPAYLKQSVGTVLQWLALEQLFSEGRFNYFDFTEGESDHKRQFATHDVLAVNVIFLRRTFKHWVLVRAHIAFDRCVEAFGAWLEENDLKRRIRRLVRFGLQPTSLPIR